MARPTTEKHPIRRRSEKITLMSQTRDVRRAFLLVNYGSNATITTRDRFFFCYLDMAHLVSMFYMRTSTEFATEPIVGIAYCIYFYYFRIFELEKRRST